MAELGAGETPRSDYPGTLDTDSILETNTTFVRSDWPNDAITAIINIETELGGNPSGEAQDVKTFLQEEHSLDGTHGNMTFDSAVGQADGGATPDKDTLYRDNIIKAWCSVSGPGVYLNSFGFDTGTAITHTTSGKYILTLSNAFTNANYCTVGTAIHSASTETRIVQIVAQTTTTITAEIWDDGGNRDADAPFMLICLGKQT
jgi:hypothetical protein